MSRPTGHSGRHTYCSISMNSEGVDALATAVGSGHRDPKSLTTYIHPSRELKTKAALTVGTVELSLLVRKGHLIVLLTIIPLTVMTPSANWALIYTFVNVVTVANAFVIENLIN